MHVRIRKFNDMVSNCLHTEAVGSRATERKSTCRAAGTVRVSAQSSAAPPLVLAEPSASYGVMEIMRL